MSVRCRALHKHVLVDVCLLFGDPKIIVNVGDGTSFQRRGATQMGVATMFKVRDYAGDMEPGVRRVLPRSAAL